MKLKLRNLKMKGPRVNRDFFQTVTFGTLTTWRINPQWTTGHQGSVSPMHTRVGSLGQFLKGG
jgi:hypothetical protein